MHTLNILTWHVHGNYLYYLTSVPHRFYVPIKEGRPEGYGGRCGRLPWPANLHEVAAEDVKHLDLDLILFQSKKNYLADQHEILNGRQRSLPRLYLEHDPPCSHPTSTRHPADDPEVTVVHVTHFNHLMWDTGRSPAVVIEHGVPALPSVQYTGEKPRGVVVINHLRQRGRRLGLDIFERIRAAVPVDLIGMQSEELGGLGEVPWTELPGMISSYRFFLNPIRYTSLGLALCEAMAIGMPIVALATTEIADVIINEQSGCISTDVDRLVNRMLTLIQDPAEAQRLGREAQAVARQRFSLERFASDWSRLLEQQTRSRPAPSQQSTNLEQPQQF